MQGDIPDKRYPGFSLFIALIMMVRDSQENKQMPRERKKKKNKNQCFNGDFKRVRRDAIRNGHRLTNLLFFFFYCFISLRSPGQMEAPSIIRGEIMTRTN